MEAGVGERSISDLPADFVTEVLSILAHERAAERVIEKIMSRLSKVLKFDAAAVLLTRKGEVSEPVFIASPTGTLSVSRTIANLAAGERKGIRVPDAVGDTVFKDGKSVAGGKIRSVLVAPLWIKRKILGVVFLSKQRPDFYTDSDLKLLLTAGPLLALAVAQTDRVGKLKKQVTNQLELGNPLPEMCGTGPVVENLKKTVRKVAPMPSPVLVLGETGTGKELIARWLHALGPGARSPFVPVNCGALPESLIESELLGHERGAFSGAQERKPGKLELASGGTLFLDEIGDLPYGMQVKLLRALEQKSFYRLGGVKPVEVSFRLVAATHRDIEKMCREGGFRKDLYYRINVISIEVAPLRERHEDIEALVGHFLRKFNGELGKDIRGMDRKALGILKSYGWPGNIRELSNVIERMVVLCDQPIITVVQLPVEFLGHTSDKEIKGESLGQKVQALERQMIVDALKKARGKKSEAAGRLGISRPTLDKKLMQYGIDIFKE
jgi:DNA-binding NtrC family response regulator